MPRGCCLVVRGREGRLALAPPPPRVCGEVYLTFPPQASIRSVLYGGLVAAFEQQPPLRDLVAELLASQLRTYLASDPADAPPDELDGAEAEAPPHVRRPPPRGLARHKAAPFARP